MTPQTKIQGKREKEGERERGFRKPRPEDYAHQRNVFSAKSSITENPIHVRAAAQLGMCQP